MNSNMNSTITADSNVTVLASRLLLSNSGLVCTYKVEFVVDPRTGRVLKVNDDQCNGFVNVRPCMLLDLMDEVYRVLGVQLGDDLPQAMYYRLPVRHPGLGYRLHPGIRVNDGKTEKVYRLDKPVQATWLLNQHVRSMVKYVRAIRDTWATIGPDVPDESHLATMARLAYLHQCSAYQAVRLPDKTCWTILVQP